MEWSLYPHQLEFCADNASRYLALIGGYGCGKTKALAIKLIILAKLNPGCKGVALSPTYQMAIRNLIPTIEEELWLQNIPFHFNKSELTFEIQVSRGKWSLIHISPAEKYKRVAGLNLAFFGVDEADLLNKQMFIDAWRMLISRLRDPRAKVYQGVAVSTPEGFKGCWQYWVDDVQKKVKGWQQRRMIKAKTEDNKSLPPEFIEDLRSQYPPELLAAYLNGEFVNLKGLPVYYRYNPSYGDGNWTAKTIENFPDHALHIGLDFNKGINPCEVHVISGSWRYLVDELYGFRDSDACISELRQRYPNREMHFYPDASGFEAFSNYERAFGSSRVHYHPKNPNVENRVASLHVGVFDPESKDRRYLVNPKKAPHADAAFQKQVYNDKGEPDKAAGLDHPVDACGYFHNYRFPVDSSAVRQQALKL
jgi:terminase large subunit-like protein